MKLMGKDFSVGAVTSYVEARLKARGLSEGGGDAADALDVEARVDPYLFNVDALAEHTDSTRGLPLETHRDGVSGRLVLLAKTAFRKGCQIFINEALGRQVVFNAHTRDAYAQLAAEVSRLKSRVGTLQGELAAARAAPVAAKPPRPRATAKKPRATVKKPPTPRG